MVEKLLSLDEFIRSSYMYVYLVDCVRRTAHENGIFLFSHPSNVCVGTLPLLKCTKYSVTKLTAAVSSLVATRRMHVCV